MTLTTTATTVDALLTVLDRDIEHAEASLSLLDALRTLLIRRDEAGLESLLSDLQREAEAHAGNESQRERLRGELAGQLGCDRTQMTLSMLRNRLWGPRRQAVAERQARLKALTADLKREYALTALLLADCTRFNQSLMHLFFGTGGKGRMIYGANGAAKRPATAALVNMHF